MNIPLEIPGRADAAVLALSLDRRRGEPLAVQLGRQLRQMILSGRIGRSARLPSSRALAVELGVSRATVVDAYDQLASEGYLEGRHGAGMFVSSALPEQTLQVPRETRTPSPAPRRRKPEPPAPAQPFQVGAIDPELFPFREWSRLLQRTWREPRRDLHAQGDPLGWMALRAAIARHLHDWRGIAADPGRIVITGGTADAVELITHIAFPPGAAALVEEPGYNALRYSLARLGIEALALPVDADGADPARIPRHRALRGAFVTPSRHFPLGVTLPLARRLSLLAWAGQHEAIIVEDDFDSEYRYEGTPLPALASLDTGDRTVYIGSFSKVLLPTLRLGFVVLPERMVAVAALHLRRRGALASLIAQPALAELMTSGGYATHIRRTRRIYGRRMAALLAEQPRLTGLLRLNPASAGMHLIADLEGQLAARCSDREAAAAAEAAGISVSALSDYYQGLPQRGALLFGFAAFPEAAITRASAALAAALTALARK